MIEKWTGIVRYRHDERSVSVEVANHASAIDAIKRQASREFNWPFSEIVLVRGRHALASAPDPDVAGSAMAGERFDGLS